jgi:hypothetical protein
LYRDSQARQRNIILSHMPNYHIETILAGARRLRGLTEKLLVGVKPGDAARKPRFGNVTIDTNTPSFILGHLSLYPGRLLINLNLDPGPCKCPDNWTDLFKAGAPCIDDVAGTLYPSLPDLAAKYFITTDHCIATLVALDDSVLATIPADERMKANFPTMGHAALFMLNSHVALHMGQLSTWRRCYGLPSAL